MNKTAATPVLNQMRQRFTPARFFKADPDRDFSARVLAYHALQAEEATHLFTVGEIMTVLDFSPSLLNTGAIGQALHEARDFTAFADLHARYRTEINTRLLAAADYRRLYPEMVSEIPKWRGRVPDAEMQRLGAIYHLAPESWRFSKPAAVTDQVARLVRIADLCGGRWNNAVDFEAMQQVLAESGRERLKHPSLRASVEVAQTWGEKYRREDNESYVDFLARQPYGEYAIRKNFSSWKDKYNGDPLRLEQAATAAVDGHWYALENFCPVRSDAGENANDRQVSLFEDELGDGHGSTLKLYSAPLSTAVDWGIRKMLALADRENFGATITERGWLLGHALLTRTETLTANGLSHDTALQQVVEEYKKHPDKGVTDKVFAEAVGLARCGGKAFFSYEKITGRIEKQQRDTVYEADENDLEPQDATVSVESSGRAMLQIAAGASRMGKFIECFSGADPRYTEALLKVMHQRPATLSAPMQRSMEGYLRENYSAKTAAIFVRLQEALSRTPPLADPLPTARQLSSVHDARVELADKVETHLRQNVPFGLG